MLGEHVRGYVTIRAARRCRQAMIVLMALQRRLQLQRCGGGAAAVALLTARRCMVTARRCIVAALACMDVCAVQF